MVSTLERSVQEELADLDGGGGPQQAAPAPAKLDEDASASVLRQRIGLFVGLLGFALVWFAPFNLEPVAQRTAAVVVLMAVWWMTEAIPIPATSLVPLVLFPALGILKPGEAAAPYANPVIFLFMGGFMLALAMERWSLHRRIALTVVALVGASPRRLVLGFMLAGGIMSMWVSNTATAAMMLPIGLAIAELLRPREPGAPFPFGTALLLSIAYGTTIGGFGTLIGSPPNVVFAAAAEELIGKPIGFVDWMMVGVPLVIIMLPLAWALLVYVLYPPGDLPSGAEELLRAERRSLGPIDRGERITMIVFICTVLAWICREPKDFGAFTLPGLTQLIPGLADETIAIAAAVALFILPVDRKRGVRVLDWATAQHLPWSVLLLFGGGLSLAAAVHKSGLAEVVAGGVASLAGLPVFAVLGLTTLLFLVLTELTSNTAVAAMGMPILYAIAIGLGQDPIMFMLAGALAASGAFMLPVATPPNAIVFGSGYISIGQMVKAGVWMSLASVIIMTLASYFFSHVVGG